MSLKLVCSIFLFTFSIAASLEVAPIPDGNCSGIAADVMFILDDSRSIWLPNFRKTLAFVSRVVDLFTIDPRYQRVGLMTFGNEPLPKIWLSNGLDKGNLKKKIINTTMTGGDKTYTHLALRFVWQQAFRPQHGGRSNASKVGILITDGNSHYPRLTKEEADNVRSHGISMFAVGMGNSVNDAELHNIASSPPSFYSFRVESYDSIDLIKEKLAIKTCHQPITTTTTTTTTTEATTTSSTTTATTTTTTEATTTPPTTTQPTTPTTTTQSITTPTTTTPSTTTQTTTTPSTTTATTSITTTQTTTEQTTTKPFTTETTTPTTTTKSSTTTTTSPTTSIRTTSQFPLYKYRGTPIDRINKRVRSGCELTDFWGEGENSQEVYFQFVNYNPLRRLPNNNKHYYRVAYYDENKQDFFYKVGRTGFWAKDDNGEFIYLQPFETNTQNLGTIYEIARGRCVNPVRSSSRPLAGGLANGRFPTPVVNETTYVGIVDPLPSAPSNRWNEPEDKRFTGRFYDSLGRNGYYQEYLIGSQPLTNFSFEGLPSRVRTKRAWYQYVCPGVFVEADEVTGKPINEMTIPNRFHHPAPEGFDESNGCWTMKKKSNRFNNYNRDSNNDYELVWVEYKGPGKFAEAERRQSEYQPRPINHFPSYSSHNYPSENYPSNNYPSYPYQSYPSYPAPNYPMYGNNNGNFQPNRPYEHSSNGPTFRHNEGYIYRTQGRRDEYNSPNGINTNSFPNIFNYPNNQQPTYFQPNHVLYNPYSQQNDYQNEYQNTQRRPQNHHNFHHRHHHIRHHQQLQRHHSQPREQDKFSGLPKIWAITSNNTLSLIQKDENDRSVISYHNPRFNRRVHVVLNTRVLSRLPYLPPFDSNTVHRKDNVIYAKLMNGAQRPVGVFILPHNYLIGQWVNPSVKRELFGSNHASVFPARLFYGYRVSEHHFGSHSGSTTPVRDPETRAYFGSSVVGITCRPTKKTDILIAVDVKGRNHGHYAWRIVKDTIQQIDMENNKVTVRFAHDLMNLKSSPLEEEDLNRNDGYGSLGQSDKGTSLNVVNIAEGGIESKVKIVDKNCDAGVFTNKTKLIKAIDSTNSMQSAGSVMDAISKNAFTDEDSKKIVIFLTDTEIEHFSKRVETMRELRESGVRVIPVGLGSEVDPMQLMALASNDAANLDYYIFNYFNQAPSKQKIDNLENLEAFFLHKTPPHPQHHHHRHRNLELYTGTKFTYRGNMNDLSTSLCR